SSIHSFPTRRSSDLERNPAHYGIFDVRYVIAPSAVRMPAFLTPIQQTPRYVLYEAPGSGYARFISLERRNSVRSQSTLFFRNREDRKSTRLNSSHDQ